MFSLIRPIGGCQGGQGMLRVSASARA
jgi:hypothetical protein